MPSAEPCSDPGCLLGRVFQCQKCHHGYCLAHSPMAVHECHPELRWTWSEVTHPHLVPS
jgi:hypothetical protein